MPEPLGRPVKVPKPVVGQDARLYAAKVLVALRQANRTLEHDRDFYDDVQRRWNGH
jgi:hypothetical protein